MFFNFLLDERSSWFDSRDPKILFQSHLFNNICSHVCGCSMVFNSGYAVKMSIMVEGNYVGRIENTYGRTIAHIEKTVPFLYIFYIV